MNKHKEGPSSDSLRAPSKWVDLSREQRREVSEYSKAGSAHPDPVVAKAAYSWAKARIEADSRSAFRKPIVMILWIIIWFPLGGAGGAAGGMIAEWKKSRMARRIVAVTEKESPASSVA
jgi:hypothetical protein